MKRRDALRIWQTVCVVVLITLMILDIIFDHDLTRTSNDWAVRAQHDGGRALRWASIFVSSVMTYWIVLFLHLYMVYNSDVMYYLYIITLFTFSLLINYVAKAIYYRARPFAVSGDLYTECACDPGMPSGHSDAAAMAYIILFRVVYRKFLRFRKNETRYPLSALLFVFCVTMTIFIMLAMIYNGVHSYSQVIIGAWSALTIASLLTFRNFLKILYRMRHHYKMISLVLLIVLNLFTLLMLFINSYLREKPDYWRFFDQQCPDCNNTWIYGQTRAIAVTYFLPAYYYFFQFVNDESPNAAVRSQPAAAHYQVGQQEGNPLQVNVYNQNPHAEPGSTNNLRTLSDMYVWRPDRRIFTRKEQAIRYGWLLLASAPALIVVGVYFFAIQPSVLDSDISNQVQSIIIWLVLGISAIYLGWATSYLKDKIFFRKGLLTYNDRLYFDDLKKRIDYPEIDSRASPSVRP